ncbi:Peptidase_C48 domain-containing protein [Cephalotus follicularis]|uniref:Peptidase_C48 domain-containing protein n=1 Tax=Cephalotus follicularis TaxID=3775 RepID=A0A1Q3BJV2_CEPFO|nr:Peptidase_C48 domain-containing protein [Cephalotus follicularis]
MVKKKPNDENNPVDLTSPLHPESNGVPMSDHRSCWLHTIAHLHARKMKIKPENLNSFQLNSPCFIHTFPHRERSKRRVRHKSAVPKLKKKLNSATFDRYLENLWRSFPKEKITSFSYIDSLWFSLYTNASSRTKVLDWIKRSHIFSKKYVFVPIVLWSHWSLLIFCHFGESLQSKRRTPCMLLLDSLEMAGPKRLEPDIRKFVLDIYKAEGRPETKKMISRIPLLVPKVPQQRDDEECGRFVLYYINLFVEGAPENFSTENFPYFMKKDWFSEEGLERFCERLDSTGK